MWLTEPLLSYRYSRWLFEWDHKSTSTSSYLDPLPATMALVKLRRFSLPTLCVIPLLIILYLSIEPSLSLSTSPEIMSQSSTTKRGALIFLHGLGDTPRGWSSLQNRLPQLRPRLAQLEYVFPAAPTVAISINGGARMPGWFDLFEWPVSVGDPDDREGLARAVRQLQDEVESLEQAGIERNRIVIGGFSQGAAVALLAAYHAGVRKQPQAANQDPLAGVVALSGWLTLVSEIQVSDLDKRTPCWWAHGKYDDKVLFNQQAFGAGKLQEHGINVSTMGYPMGHESDPQEIRDLAEFLDNLLFGSEKSEL